MRQFIRAYSIFFTLILILLGTSLALGIFNGNVNISNEGLAENGDHSEHTMPDDDKGNSVQRVAKEETPKQEEQADNDGDLAAEATDDEPDAVRAASKEEYPEEGAKNSTDNATPEDPEPQTETNRQMARVTATALNVRPDPSTNNQRIDVLLQGQTVEVLAEQNNWLQIKLADGRTGWIYGAYVSRFFSPPGAGDALAGRVIVIDPGHGGSDPGAVGITGLQEKEVVLDVSLRVADQLRAAGAEVIMTRETDVFISLVQRVAISESAGADVFVSVHANAHPSSAIGGTETYYYHNKATSNASFKLASSLQHELVGALGLRNIGVKYASFLVIRQTSMPSALVELAFLSNAHEESLMRTNEFRQNAADAIVRGIKNYFK